jgi:5-methylcytosine-specific restriction enzyme A
MPDKIRQFQPAGTSAHTGKDRHVAYNQTGRDRELLALYGSGPWKRFRESIRRARVLCEDCRAGGRVVVGSHVHHLIDPRDDPSLAFEPSNVRLLCHSCHSTTHAKQQGRRPR